MLEVDIPKYLVCSRVVCFQNLKYMEIINYPCQPKCFKDCADIRNAELIDLLPPAL